MKKFIGAEQALGKAMSGLNIAVEAYPDLKADSHMSQLMSELSETEDRISLSRQSYNDDVMSYNTYRQSFPNIIVANFFGHAVDAELLAFDDSAKINNGVKVSF